MGVSSRVRRFRWPESLPSEEVEMAKTKPRVRIRGRGDHLRVRLGGDWAGDPLAGVAESCRSSVAVDKALAEAMQRSRAAGLSWDEIGRSLGIWEEAPDKEALVNALLDSRRARVEYLLRNIS